MKDERRLCANCNHLHKWGVLRYGQGGEPLYGPRHCDYLIQPEGTCFDHQKISCPCDRFVHKQEGDENLPAMTQQQMNELWSQTSFLNAQVPAATRLMVKQIIESGKGNKGLFSRLLGGAGKSVMERQWPEFMGLMISQLTDLRGAMFRDENKFAHLVAHTDEIVEAMRGVTQLKERLDNIYAIQERVLEAVDKLASKVAALESSNNSPSESSNIIEAAHVFAAKSQPLWNEPIPTDAEPVDD